MTDSPIAPERLQHDRITRDEHQSADSEGGIGQPYRVEGLLARLQRHGDIGPGEKMAGEKFAELFRQAHMDPLHAAGMAQRCHAVAAGEPNGVSARERLNLVLDDLGGLGTPVATASWFVLGHQMSIRQWSMRESWGGRPLSQAVAKGLIIAALHIIRRHFGY